MVPLPAIELESARSRGAAWEPLELGTPSQGGPRLCRLRLRILTDETVVIRHSATGGYEMRRLRSTSQQDVAPAAAIDDTEFEELAALRKAQAWGTPVFQPGHPKHQQVLARLTELEAKERACGAQLGSTRKG